MSAGPVVTFEVDLERVEELSSDDKPFEVWAPNSTIYIVHETGTTAAAIVVHGRTVTLKVDAPPSPESPA